MPTYKYRREDGTTFTIRQKITADALETCPETGQKVERVIQPANFHLKGSGFYSTDYKDRGGPKKDDASNSDASSSSGGGENGSGSQGAEGSSSTGSGEATSASSSGDAA